MFTHWSRLFVILIVGALSACTAIQAFPNREVPPPEALEGDLLFIPQDVITRYYAAEAAKKNGIRDAFVTRRMTEIDYRFINFLTRLRTESTAAALGVDLSVLGLSAAGAVLSPGNVTQILAATSGALTGARTSYEKNVLLEQTVNALIAQMQARRAQIRTQIFRRLKADDYALPIVQSDLQEYYFAGTIPGAIAAVTQNAGVAAAQAEEDVENIIDVQITPELVGLRELITGGGDRILPERAVLFEECARQHAIDLTQFGSDTNSRIVQFLLEASDADKVTITNCIKARLS